MTTPLEEPEAGLAGERTALAWNRSGLAVVVCVAVLVRHAWPLHGAEHEVALGLIAGAAIVWCVVLAVLTLSRGTPGSYVPRGAAVFRLVTAGTLLLAFVGFVAALAAP